MGRLLIVAGIALIAMGLLFLLGEKMGIRLGRLPGDIRIESARGGFYFPVVTCLLLSALLTLLGWLFGRR